MPFLIPFIPVIIAAGAYGLGMISLTAFLITAATAALSFVAQTLLKPAAQSPMTQLSSAASVAIDQKQTIRQAVAPRKVGYGRTRVGGIIAAIACTHSNQYLRMALPFLGHECDAIEEIRINDVVSPIDAAGEVSGGKYAGAAYFAKHLGGADQEADAMLLDAYPGWTVNHRLRGICYLAASLYWNQSGSGTIGLNLWSGGLPNITVVGRCKKIYDPRTGETAYSNNSALVVADYLCDPLYGLSVDYASGINEEALIAAANACDEDIPLADGGTEKRYATDGVFQSDAKPDEILGRLLGAMHGKAIYDGERWTILAGVYQEPTIILTDDDMYAMSELQTLTSARDSFNGVKGTYVSEENQWQAADFPAVISQTFKAADAGRERLKDIELPFTISPSRAQRIAKIDLLLARQEIVEKFTGKLSCWRVRTGDTIMRTSERYGWTEKPFYVQACSFGVDQDLDGNPVIVVNLILQETSASAFDWLTSEEQTVDPAPNTDFPEVFGTLPPSNLRKTESLYSSRDGGGVKAMVVLEYDASPDAFVTTGGHYRGRFMRVGDPGWTPIVETTGLRMELLDMRAGAYYAEVRAVNWAGNASDPVTLAFEVVGLSAIPATPTNFGVSAHDSVARAAWDRAPDLDVREGGSHVIKHSPELSGVTWENALTLDDEVPGDATRWILPLIAGTYLIKARDASGNYSDGYATFVQLQSSVHAFNPIDSIIQDPAFDGAKTNTVLSGGFLVLDGALSFDDVPDTDDLEAWDYLGGVAAEGYYDYDDILDNGALTKCRLTNVCLASIINVYDDFDTREADVDSWPSWDGEVFGSEADSWLTVAYTQDDPSGSPVWSEYERLHSSSFEAWAFKFRRRLVSYDTSFTPAIAEDAVYSEEV